MRKFQVWNYEMKNKKERKNETNIKYHSVGTFPKSNRQNIYYKECNKKMQISNLVRSKVCEQRILVCCKSLRSDKYWLCSEC